SARPAVACASASRYVALLDPSSVPTRRSSDLFFSAPIYKRLEARCPVTGCQLLTHPLPAITASTATIYPPPWRILFHHHLGAGGSEEHTSELQSRENLVCRRLTDKNTGTATPA